MSIRFSPDQQHVYWADGTWQASDTPLVLFGFGGEPSSLVYAPLRNSEEPNDFHVFRATWEAPGLAGDLAGLWAGFMALRYCLGYFTQWELISAELRDQAQRLDPLPGGDQRSLASQIQGWSVGWERQLDPLMAELRSVIRPRFSY